VTMPPVSRTTRPSTWFLWHGHRVGPGARVLDLACGEGRHALAAAARGARVTAIDKDEVRLAAGRERAEAQGLSIEWTAADLEEPWPQLGGFDAVLMFNYLDRAKMPQMIELVEPGGFLMMETFLSIQLELGWGPTSDEHLLQPGELARLVAPLEVVHGREVLEAVDAERWRAVASVLAVKK
jgi:2-polyprenyl-3-methyl-5-hydroxy-6-metoxy-1,4-benzoquinol methylase